MGIKLSFTAQTKRWGLPFVAAVLLLAVYASTAARTRLRRTFLFVATKSKGPAPLSPSYVPSESSRNETTEASGQQTGLASPNNSSTPKRNTPRSPSRATTEQPNRSASSASRPPSTALQLDAARFLRGPDAPQPTENSSAAAATAPLRPRTLAQTCHRALAGPVGDASSDGMGHRLTLVLYELQLAMSLDVAYLHRVSPYGSLTAGDPAAVQRLFGWLDYPDKRDAFLRRHCVVRRNHIGACRRVRPDEHEWCARLKPDSPFRRVVRLPQSLTDCLVKNRISVCEPKLREFAKEHGECGTLFQALPSRCSFDYSSGGSDAARDWLRARYWGKHAASTALVPARELQRGHGALPTREAGGTGTSSRILPFRGEALQIAVHVRRGDLFRYTHRKMLPDAAYGAAVAAAVAQARRLRRGVDVDVSVFSEGAPPVGETVKRSSHDVAAMTADYVTERGVRVRDADAHWTGVVADALARRRGDNGETDEDEDEDEDDGDVSVRAFIATDTVVAIHTMLCADVFVGSRSGLSIVVAGKLGRGVMLFPRARGKRDSVKKRTIYFDAEEVDRDNTSLVNERMLRKTLLNVLERQTERGVHP